MLREIPGEELSVRTDVMVADLGAAMLQVRKARVARSRSERAAAWRRATRYFLRVVPQATAAGHIAAQRARAARGARRG